MRIERLQMPLPRWSETPLPLAPVSHSVGPQRVQALTVALPALIDGCRRAGRQLRLGLHSRKSPSPRHMSERRHVLKPGVIAQQSLDGFLHALKIVTAVHEWEVPTLAAGEFRARDGGNVLAFSRGRWRR